MKLNPPPRLVVRRLISTERLQTVATLAAKVQGVDVLQATAPTGVTTAIRDLHQIAGLAAGTLLRRKGAEALFRQRISSSPRRGVGSELGGRTRGAGIALTRISDALGGNVPCVGQFAGGSRC